MNVKIFYAPNFISILALFCLGLSINPLSKTESTFHREPVFKFFVPCDEMNNANCRFSKYDVFKTLKHKKILTVKLGENHNLNLKKIEFIRQETRRINYGYQGNNVIKVHFEEDANYGEFVIIISNLQEDLIKRYALVDDNLYIMGEELPVNN